MESVTPEQQREVTVAMARRTRKREPVDYKEEQESDVGDSDDGQDRDPEFEQESDVGEFDC
jgi:hypothetical protein